MLWVSLFTAFTGLTEPLFVPSYWNPPSLFNLASTTRFDIESLIFSWGAGGIGSVLYEAVLKLKHKKMLNPDVQSELRWLHLASLFALPVVFSITYFGLGWNPIYSVSSGLIVAAVAAVVCRPDLGWSTLLGGLLYMGMYFAMFSLMILVAPRFIDAWNLSALSGVLVYNVPLEELMFSFAFGMMWSGVYEHIRHYVLRRS
jgi:hypothetical protein